MPIGKTEFFYQNPDAPVPNQPIGVGVLALIHNSGSLLLERRRDCGRWGLIGGSMEMHETPTKALRREVLEETNLVVTHETLICVAADPSRIVRYPDGNTIRVISFVFEASVEDFSTLNRSDESLQLRFFEDEELAEADIVETAWPLIERYLETGTRGTILMEGRD